MQACVRVGAAADAALLDAWLTARAPLPVPEARARRLSLEALLAQGGHGICLIAEQEARGEPGPRAVQALLPVTLVHSLSTGGRAALAIEWWAPPAADAAAGPAPKWLAACCGVLADWCRAHGIRHALLAPGLVPDRHPPAGFAAGSDGLWHRCLVPTPKRLG